MGLPENFRRAGKLPERDAASLPALSGVGAVLAGSCSRATLGSARHARERVPVLQLDPLAHRTAQACGEAREWMADHLGDKPIVIAASAPPDQVTALQQLLGRDAAGALIEQTLARSPMIWLRVA